jgi:hypothetical protein
MKELLEAQKGYLAGILDGEGCLSIRHQKGQRSFLNFRGRLANGENSVDTQNGQYRAEPCISKERVTVSPEIMDISTPLERDDMTCTTKELVEVGNRKPTITS